eukprot:SAG31_NODE_46_length_30980_cov_226.095107_11_plen_336_part_00
MTTQESRQWMVWICGHTYLDRCSQPNLLWHCPMLLLAAACVSSHNALTLFQASTSPRTEMMVSNEHKQGVVSTAAIIVGNYKLILGIQLYGFWQGPVYPNASTDHEDEPPIDCAAGCLYDIHNDAEERVELSSLMPARKQELSARWSELNRTTFEAPPFPLDQAKCAAYLEAHNGFLGPYYEDPEPAKLKLDDETFLRAGVQRGVPIGLGTAFHWTVDNSSSPACLDGSRFSIKYRLSTSGSTKWTISIPGGGWCYDELSCLFRANSTCLGKDCTSEGTTAHNACDGGHDDNCIVLAYVRSKPINVSLACTEAFAWHAVRWVVVHVIPCKGVASP